MKKPSADQALERYYATLRGPSTEPKPASLRWVLAGPAAVLLMIAMTSQWPAKANEELPRFLFQRQAEMVGLSAPDIDRRRAMLRRTRPAICRRATTGNASRGALA